MPGPLRITLKGLDPAAYLESRGGTVVSVASQSRLDGLFVLVVGGQVSDPLSFDAATTLAIVTALGTDWSITKLAGATFTHSQELFFSDGSGPWLRADHCSLIQKNTQGATALLSIFDARVSLSTTGLDPGQGRIVYPTQNGDQTETLVAPQHPQDPYSFGFFVYPSDNNGFVVRMGTVKQPIQLDHAIATDVLVDNDCDVLFTVPAAGVSATRVIFDSSKAGDGTAVRAAVTSNLMMAQTPTDGRWSRLKLSTSSMEVSGGKLRTVSFKGTDAWLGHVSDPATDFDAATSLFTPVAKLSYELDILPQANASFIYADPDVQKGMAAKGFNRFYGLRVSGLGSRQGVRPALDADVLTFALATDGTLQFHIQAGLGGNYLGPKVNAKNLLLERSIEIPLSSQLGVVNSGPAIPGSASLLQLDTASGKLIMVSPSLLSAPAGITAKSPTILTNAPYLRWALSLPQQQPAVFSLAPNQLIPADGMTWLNPFKTTNGTVQYGLLEHPGMQLMMDGAAVSASTRLLPSATNSTNQTTITHKNPSGTEYVAYSAFFAVLSWAGYEYAVDGAAALDEKNFIISYPSLDDPTLAQFVKANKLQDLQIVLYSGYLGSTGVIKDFVDKNMLAKTSTPPTKYLWPFAAGMSVLLYDNNFDAGDGTPPSPAYCDRIALKHNAGNAGGPAVKTTVALDLSNQTKLLDTLQGVYGEAPPAWTKWISDSPSLWPKASGRGGSRTDPSDILWRGVFLRDLPLVIPVPKSNFPVLSNLIASINNKLMLQYGWRDESGATWSAQLDQTFQDGLVTSNTWTDTLQISLISVTLKGAAGSVVSSEGNCTIVLPLIKDSNNPGQSLTFNAALGINLDSSTDPITKLDVTVTQGEIATESVPGFASVEVTRFSTDFKTAQFDLNLLAKDGLASALPFFSSTKPQKATLAFNLSATPSPTISLILPNEAQTNLFGKWPIALEAISIQFGAGNAFTETRIRGRIHLGMPELASVGATVVIRQEGTKLQLNVELDEITAALSFGDLSLTAGLVWKDAAGTSGPLDLTGVGNTGKDREFWALLTLSDPGVLGSNSLMVRVGNQGEISFWIAALQIGSTLSVGVAEIQQPALILAHNADYSGGLQKIIDDPTKSVLADVRPDTNMSLITWLGNWKPSSSIGTVIAGSGFIHLASQIAEAAGSDPVKDKNSLSSILFSSAGMFRIDGLLMMLGAVPLRFGLAVDYVKETITAGLQGPQFTLPPGSDTYKISAGYITIGMGFKGTKDLRVGIGWPERVGGTEFDRDWTKATSVYVSTFWPINTFWGGFLAEVQASDKGDFILFGFAVRAGWTWSASASIGGVVSGSADLGITLGGVFMFQLAWDLASGRARHIQGIGRTPLGPLQRVLEGETGTSQKPDPEITVIFDSLVSVDAALSAMANWDFSMSAEIFGDVWGKASVKFLGVSLCSINVTAFARFVICGSLSSGIDKAAAEVGFDVSVQILCVTFHASATIDVTLINGTCKIQQEVLRNQFAQLAPILAATPSATALAIS